MPNLLESPNEILSLIIRELYLPGLCAFASQSSRIHQLCIFRLAEHKTTRVRYHFLYPTKLGSMGGTDEGNWYSVWKDLIEDDGIPFFRRITIDVCGLPLTQLNKPVMDDAFRDTKLRKLFEYYLECSRWVPVEMKPRVLQYALIGDEDALLSVILPLFTNLKNIEIVGGVRGSTGRTVFREFSHTII